MCAGGRCRPTGRSRSVAPAHGCDENVHGVRAAWGLAQRPTLSTGSGEPVLEEPRCPGRGVGTSAKGRQWRAAPAQTACPGRRPAGRSAPRADGLAVVSARGVRMRGARRARSALANDLVCVWTLSKMASCCFIRVTMVTSSTGSPYSVTRVLKQCLSVRIWAPVVSGRCLGTLGLGPNTGCCWLLMGRGR